MNVFRSAIDGGDGMVDAGYLALFWTMTVTVGVIPLVVAVGGLAAYYNPKDAAAIIQSTGIAVGAICTGAGAVIGAVGLFRAGDKPRPVVVAQPAALAPGLGTPAQPLKVDVVDEPKAGRRGR